MPWLWWLSGYGGSNVAGTIEEVRMFPGLKAKSIDPRQLSILDAIAAAESDDDERGA